VPRARVATRPRSRPPATSPEALRVDTRRLADRKAGLEDQPRKYALEQAFRSAGVGGQADRCGTNQGDPHDLPGIEEAGQNDLPLRNGDENRGQIGKPWPDLLEAAPLRLGADQDCDGKEVHRRNLDAFRPAGPHRPGNRSNVKVERAGNEWNEPHGERRPLHVLRLRLEVACDDWAKAHPQEKENILQGWILISPTISGAKPSIAGFRGGALLSRTIG